MLEREVIESGLYGVMEIIRAYELAIHVRQAEAVKMALRSPTDRGSIIDRLTASINKLAQEAKREAATKAQQEIGALVQSDLDKQMRLYQLAFEKGIALTKPQVPQSVILSNEYALTGTMRFIDSTIERIAGYAGQSAASVIDMAIADKFAGVTTHTVSKAASALILEEGIKITMPSGRNVHDVYAYVRQNVVSAVSFNSAEQQRELAESIHMPEGKKWYATSSHFGARPEHAKWQGRIFKSWAEFVEKTGYGTITGLGGINCRHTFYIHIPGVSEQAFHPKNQAENDRRYKAQQLRRRMESNIRKFEAEDAVNKALGIEPRRTAQVKALRSKLRAHMKLQQELAKAYAKAT